MMSATKQKLEQMVGMCHNANYDGEYEMEYDGYYMIMEITIVVKWIC